MTFKKQNNNIINIFAKRRNLKSASIEKYTYSLNNYSEFNKMSLQDLLNEAEQEEDERIRLKRRTIKKRLINYKIYLESEKHASTARDYLLNVKTFYSEFEIDLPKIKPVKQPPSDGYEVILTKEQIRNALDHCKNKKLKALILFMLSSGTARAEALSITIEDFINATREYHNEITLYNVIQSLKQQNNIIPTFNLIRQKKERTYFTFCSPEAVHHILIYLEDRLYREQVKLEDKLFNYSTPRSLPVFFRQLNDICQFGKNTRGTHSIFHPHGLRKFFATNMVEAGLSPMYVDLLEGRKFSSVHQAYIKLRPEKVKPYYMSCLDAVTIYDKVNYVDITSKEKQELEDLRIANGDLVREHQEDRRRLAEIERFLDQFKE